MAAFGSNTNPTAYEQFQSTRESANAAEFYRRVALSDSRAQMINSMASIFEANGNYKAASLHMNSDAGKLQHQAIASMFNSGILGGGSSEIMAAGIRQMVVSSSMRSGASVEGKARTSPLFGEGRIQNDVSEALYNSINSKMFSPVTGLGNINKTAGFNRTQIGEIAANLGAQGAFSGLDASHETSKDGRTTNILSKDTAKYIEKKIEDTAKMLAVVRSITGGTAVNELASQATALTGMSGHNVAAITGSLNQLKDEANKQGVSVGELGQARMSNMQGLVSKGFGSAVAGGLLSATEEEVTVAAISRKADAAAAAKRGVFTRSYTTEELRNSAIKDSSRLLMENPNLAEAGAYLSNEGLGTKETKAELESAVADFGNVKTDADRSKAQARLAAAIQAHSGMQAGSMTRALGTTGVQDSMGDAQANLVGKAAQQARANLVGNQLISNIARQGGASEEATKAAQTFFAAFDTSTKNGLTDALKENDMGKFSTILDNNKAQLVAGGMKAEDFENLKTAANKDPAKLNQLLANVKIHGGVRLAEMGDLQTKIAVEESAATEAYLAHAIGDKDKIPEDIFTSIQRGALSDRPVTSGNIVNYLTSTKGKGKIEKVDIKDNAPATAEQAQALSKVLNTYGDFNKTLGLGKDATGEEIQAAMKTPEGMKSFRQFLKQNDVTYTQDKTQLNVVNKGDSDKTKERLQLALEAKSLLQLQGISMDSKEGKTITENYINDRVTQSDETINPEDSAKTKAEKTAKTQARIKKNTETETAAILKKLTPEFLAKTADKTSVEFATLAEYKKTHGAQVEAALMGAGNAAKKKVDNTIFLDKDEKKVQADIEATKANLKEEGKAVDQQMLTILRSIDQSLKVKK